MEPLRGFLLFLWLIRQTDQAPVPIGRREGGPLQPLPGLSDRRGSFFPHHIVGKHDAPSHHLLCGQNTITSCFKKRFCCQGGVRCDWSRNTVFQDITKSRSDPPSLMVCVDKQTVKIPSMVNISEPHKALLLHSDQGDVLPERSVPGS